MKTAEEREGKEERTPSGRKVNGPRTRSEMSRCTSGRSGRPLNVIGKWKNGWQTVGDWPREGRQLPCLPADCEVASLPTAPLGGCLMFYGASLVSSCLQDTNRTPKHHDMGSRENRANHLHLVAARTLAAQTHSCFSRETSCQQLVTPDWLPLSVKSPSRTPSQRRPRQTCSPTRTSSLLARRLPDDVHNSSSS
jgi:hypothetical protein